MHQGDDPGLKGSWEWLQWAARLPAKPIPFATSAANLQLFTGRCIFWGVQVINTSTTAGIMTAYDGRDTTGPELGSSSIAASGRAGLTAPAVGVLCESGVYLALSSSTVTGSLLCTPLWHYPFTPPGE